MSFDLTSSKTVKLSPLSFRDEQNASTIRSAVCALLKPDCNMFTKGQIINSLMLLLSINEKQAAKALGLSNESVKRKLSVLRFSDFEQKLILNSGMCEMSAFVLSSLPSVTRRFAVIYCTKNKLSYQNTRDYVERLSENKKAIMPKSKIKPLGVNPKGFVANIGIIINSIEKASVAAEQSGFETSFTKDESDSHINLSLTFSKKPHRKR